MRRFLFALGATAVLADEAVEKVEKVEEEKTDEPKLVDGFTPDQLEKMAESGESHEFQAEVSRLMDIIINSLYTDKQVFLRELISNSADALEKVRFYSTSDPNYLGDTKDLDIKLEFDATAKTLSITDTGCGMTKTDLINNLGTVAKSGTTNFLEAMAEGGDANLIGQFGVGFYSAFLVADKVTVTSKSNDEPAQSVWESTADAKFTLSEDPRGATLGRGTRITLHLKEDALDYLSENKLKETVGKYSQFIQYPIYVKTKKEVEVDDFDDSDDEDEDDDKEEEEKEDEVKKVEFDWEQINTEKAVWKRAKEDVTDEQYRSFYKAFSKDYLDPLSWTHFTAEGEVDFNSILFIPEKLPREISENYSSSRSEIKLFVRRVLVSENFEDLLPKYLNFIKGVVDSDDLPLNVSREQLQQNKIMKVISKKLVRKVLEMLKNIAKESEPDEDEEEDSEDKPKKKASTKYELLWKEFGKNLKMGCYEDDANRSKISKLLRFYSSKSGDAEISLDKYVDTMPEKQDSIYYISGDSRASMMKMANLQIFKKKDIEVLLLEDPIDEPCLQKLSDFEGKKLVSIQKADVKLEETEDEIKRFNRMKDVYKPLTEWWSSTLKGSNDEAIKALNFEAVVLSKRLTTDPVVVVSSQFGYTPQQERMWRSQTFTDKTQLAMMAGKKTLEINGNHPVIVDLLAKVKADKDDKLAHEIAETMFTAAAVGSGYDLVDSSTFATRVYRMISNTVKVDPDAPVVDIELPEVEEEGEEEEAAEEDDKKEEEDETVQEEL